jgi:TatA/E family protein of Tat protein translocase
MPPYPVTAIFLGAGLDEWALLVVLTFILFGPRRLPAIARTLGRTLARFRRAADDFRDQLERMDEEAPPAPSVAPDRERARPADRLAGPPGAIPKKVEP